MKKIFFLLHTILILTLTISNGFSAKSDYFEKGKNLFEKNEFEKSKFFFEKDIVFNPKSEKSYLFLAKIFEKDENDNQLEMNLNSVLTLNPQNDEAIYMLTVLKIKQSDYDQAKELIEKFDMVCESFCFKKSEIKQMFNKLIPENEKNNN
tara:strand:- start:18610 stop:19059 length:450 start_codon:yes stop_codon:yes gene_type:complete